MDLTLELDQPVLECGVQTAAPQHRKPQDGVSTLALSLDHDKFFALYDDLLQAHALVQHAQAARAALE